MFFILYFTVAECALRRSLAGIKQDSRLSYSFWTYNGNELRKCFIDHRVIERDLRHRSEFFSSSVPLHDHTLVGISFLSGLTPAEMLQTVNVVGL